VQNSAVSCFFKLYDCFFKLLFQAEYLLLQAVLPVGTLSHLCYANALTQQIRLLAYFLKKQTGLQTKTNSHAKTSSAFFMAFMALLLPVMKKSSTYTYIILLLA
jgi:hypothetical protein